MMDKPQKLVVIGAGPVGTLAALYGAQRGYEVEVYELRPDLRDAASIPLNFTKSINLALSERGIHALRQTGRPEILETVMKSTIPMRGRMIHGRDAKGQLYEDAQDYDIFGRTIYAADRNSLNSTLLDLLLGLPNVTVFFNHKLTGVDFKACKAWLEVKDTKLPNGRYKEIEIDFDFMIGADGAHSATRYHLMKYARMDYQQEYIDTMWCEFRMEAASSPSSTSWRDQFRISPNHLHIWPGRQFMFIAIANDDGSLTCTLFMPQHEFTALEADDSLLPAFFDKHFPGVRDHIPDEQLLASFRENPHLPLISIKCKPYHFGSSGIVVGDAAHAMVPFYGQGMNAGLEDVRILFSILDKHAELDESNSPSDMVSVRTPAAQRASALAEYSAIRYPDAHAINDLAVANYDEMRSSVLSKQYRLRKFLEEFMSLHFGSFGWSTKYSRVTFSSERYSQVVSQNEHQGKMLLRCFVGAVSSPFVLTAVVGLYKFRKSIWGLFTGGSR